MIFIRANISLFIMVCATLLLWPVQTASACSCISSGPPCQAYWTTSAVFSGRVTEISSSNPDSESADVFGQRLVRFTQTEVYRGVTENTLEVLTGSGGGDCGYSFKVGESYLVYAYRNPKDNKLYASICSRTRLLSEATEDLDFIRGLAKTEGGGTIYGLVNSFRRVRTADGNQQPPGPLAGVAVTIEGSGKTLKLLTDVKGEFRSSSLPSGNYSVRVTAPEGLWPANTERKVKIEDKGCAALQFSLEPDTSLSGKVLDESGGPASKIMVDLMPSSLINDRAQSGNLFVQTDDEGRFEFRSIPPGEYYLGIRLSRIAEPTFAYPRTFYPSTQDLSRAEAITIGEGQNLQGYTIQLPQKLTPRRIEGIVLWPDGKPVPNAGICFEEVEYAEGALCFGGDARVGEDGRFSFTAFNGLRYIVRVHASVPGAGGSGQRHAEPVEVPANGNITNLRIVITEPNGTCPKCIRWTRKSGQ